VRRVSDVATNKGKRLMLEHDNPLGGLAKRLGRLGEEVLEACRRGSEAKLGFVWE